MSDTKNFETYDPIGTLKPFGADIWIADGEIIWMKYVLGSLPFTTRMTVVRLRDGTLWIWSPISLTAELKAEVEALGPVAHIVSPNAIHYANIPDWAKAWPQARIWASPSVRKRAKNQGIRIIFTDDLTDEPPTAWSSEIDQQVFEGSRLLTEVTFFHRHSRTLILADLIENFETARLPRFYAFLMRIAGTAHPDGKLPIDLRLGFLGRKRKARASLQRLLDWQPEQIIIAHGRCYRENAVAELKRAFRWLKP